VGTPYKLNAVDTALESAARFQPLNLSSENHLPGGFDKTCFQLALVPLRNDVPLLAGGSGDGGDEEVGKVTVTARAWQRAALLVQREKEIAGGFDAGGGLGVGGDGAWMLSAMATDMVGGLYKARIQLTQSLKPPGSNS
jgi:hypothetical protein